MSKEKKKSPLSIIFIVYIVGAMLFGFVSQIYNDINMGTPIEDVLMPTIIGIVIFAIIIKTTVSKFYKSQNFSKKIMKYAGDDIVKGLKLKTTINQNIPYQISENANNKQAIKTELAKFKKITKKQKVTDNTYDLTVIFKDKSEHLYRAYLEKDGFLPKITRLERYT